MAETALGERVAFLKGACAQLNERTTTLQWMVGLSMAWNTMLIGAAVATILTYR
jgi:hypothetical protein